MIIAEAGAASRQSRRENIAARAKVFICLELIGEKSLSGNENLIQIITAQ
jgi:hypothetical protein